MSDHTLLLGGAERKHTRSRVCRMVAERRFRADRPQDAWGTRGEGGRDDAIYDIGNNSHFLFTGK